MNAGSKKLFSSRYVIGFPEQRLAYLADKIAEQRADYCVVLQPKTQRYLGMFRIADIAVTEASFNRILADLLESNRFVDVLPDTDIRVVERLLLKEDLGVVAVVDHEGEFLGLITSESLNEYALREERRRARESLRSEQSADGILVQFDSEANSLKKRKDA